MNKAIYVSLIIFTVVSLIIGLPCWLVGCRKNIESQCLSSSIKDLTVSNKYTKKYNCVVCTRRCAYAKTTRCCETEDVFCEDFTVVFSDSTNTEICKFKNNNDEIYNKYQLNSTYHIIVRDDGQCYLDITLYENLWITGIFFLSLTGSLIAILIVSVILNRHFRKYTDN